MLRRSFADLNHIEGVATCSLQDLHCLGGDTGAFLPLSVNALEFAPSL